MKSVVSAECNILKNGTVVSHFFKSAVDKIYRQKDFRLTDENQGSRMSVM